MTSKKETVETVETAEITSAEQTPQVVQLQNVGACAIRYKGTNYVYEQVFEVPESEIDRFRHEIFKGRVEFYDNPKRTREYIAAVKATAKEIVQPKSAE
ncbi:hypothetical protein FAIRDINKUM_10 [Klebsiella phage vB_KpnD_FairDinkum]|uniref:Uncharacterized protein n=1 Tax=Klebsiella phage vB_KpnD_FairDinkum TaxID=2902662 RepID=A0AAE8YXI6_9CAUD|nr:hypothetical protein FAIRDINKUM_10 [Klebsiella phage vB_KpnD_FairDinkum]